MTATPADVLDRKATLLAESDGAQVYHADWRALLPVVEAAGGADLLCVDAPYSERTHAGHDAISDKAVALGRREINYSPWNADNVREFVEAWSPLTRGWFVSLTDDVLAQVWRAEFERDGRCAFAPLPFVQFGSRVRLCGDGPSSITTQISVARPRNLEFARWGTLTGAYVTPPGLSDHPPVVGGKIPWIMCRIVEDYSRPSDLCVDPCCGAGTLAAAAIRTGRRAIVGDSMREHADLAALWIKHPWRRAPSTRETPPLGQQPLFATAGARK